MSDLRRRVMRLQQRLTTRHLRIRAVSSPAQVQAALADGADLVVITGVPRAPEFGNGSQP